MSYGETRTRSRAAPAGAPGARLVEASATHRGGYAPGRDPAGRDLATRPQRDLPLPGGWRRPHPRAGSIRAGLGEPGKVVPKTVQLDLLPAEHADVPVTPLLLADAAGFSELQQRPRRPSRQAHISLCPAAMPMSARVPGGSYTWEPTLEEIRDLLWPKSPRTGKSSWKPSKHDRALYQALDAVNLAKVKLPNRDGLWLPVRTWRQPDPRNLDSRALIEIALPPGCAVGGPKLDRAGWIADGPHSDPGL